MDHLRLNGPRGSEASDHKVLFKTSDNSLKIHPKERAEWMEKVLAARHRYITSFTVHAVEHIINGEIPEKVGTKVKRKNC